MQLNLYKFLLQKYYGLRVRGMFIVGLHPDNFAAGPFLDEVPDMQQDSDAMLQVHRARLVAWQPQAGHEGLEVFGGAVTRTELPIEVLESMPTHFFSCVKVHAFDRPAFSRLGRKRCGHKQLRVLVQTQSTIHTSFLGECSQISSGYAAASHVPGRSGASQTCLVYSSYSATANFYGLRSRARIHTASHGFRLLRAENLSRYFTAEGQCAGPTRNFYFVFSS